MAREAIHPGAREATEARRQRMLSNFTYYTRLFMYAKYLIWANLAGTFHPPAQTRFFRVRLAESVTYGNRDVTRKHQK